MNHVRRSGIVVRGFCLLLAGMMVATPAMAGKKVRSSVPQAVYLNEAMLREIIVGRTLYEYPIDKDVEIMGYHSPEGAIYIYNSKTRQMSKVIYVFQDNKLCLMPRRTRPQCYIFSQSSPQSYERYNEQGRLLSRVVRVVDTDVENLKKRTEEQVAKNRAANDAMGAALLGMFFGTIISGGGGGNPSGGSGVKPLSDEEIWRIQRGHGLATPLDPGRQ